MKICLVVHQFLPKYSSGTELYVLAVAKELIRRGHEVRVFAGEPAFAKRPRFQERTGRPDDIPSQYLTVSSPMRGNRVLAEYYNPLAAKLFGRFLEVEAIDLVHFCHVQGLGVGLLEEARLRSVPFLVQFFDFWSVCPKATLLREDGELCEGPRLLEDCVACMRSSAHLGYQVFTQENMDVGPIELRGVEGLESGRLAMDALTGNLAAAQSRLRFVRETTELASLLLSPSKFLRKVLVSNGFRRESIKVCRYPVDGALRLKSPRGNRRRRVRFGYVGSLVPHKGVEVLIDAFRSTPEQGVTLVIHGDPISHPDYARMLREIAAPDQRIRFAGAFHPSQRVKVYDGIDVLVVPSLWHENTPFVVLEAQAAGIPVIAPRVGGMTEVVRNGIDGVLFDRGDAVGLGQVMKELIVDPARLNRLAEGAPPVKRMAEHADELLSYYELTRAAGSLQ